MHESLFYREQMKTNSTNISLNQTTLVFIADGWARNEFLSLLDEGLLPGIKQLIEMGGSTRDVISNVPSISIASHLSIMTSSYICDHQICAHRWLDRKNHRFRNYLGLRGIRQANREVKTPYLSFFSNFPGKTLAIQQPLTLDADQGVFAPSFKGKDIIEKASKAIQNHSFCRAVIWLPKVDELSHKFGPKSESVKKEMIETSAALATMIEELRRSERLSNTRIVFVPDHGQKTVTHPKGAKVEKLLRKSGIRAKTNSHFFYKKNLVCTSGDSFAQIYLQNKTPALCKKIAVDMSECKEIEIACWKEDDLWFFAGRRGISKAKILGETKVWYSLVQGADPLGLEKTGEINISQPSLSSGYYPDFLHQVIRSYVPNKSGDIFLFASEEFHFGRSPRVGWNFGKHKGSHGGPLFDEVVVTAVCYGFGSGLPKGPIRSADLLKSLDLIGAA